MSTQKQAPGSARLVSLDALRGFDMFWIVGGKGIFVALAAATGFPLFQWWSTQLEHVEWHGFHFYDMIFPLFLFIAGVSFPFSFTYKYKGSLQHGRVYRDVLRRGLLLVLLGIVYNNAIRFDFENLRYASVLGRIGLAWMFAALLYVHTGVKGRVAVFFALLIGYWLLLLYFPAPDLGETDPFSIKGNLAGYIDRLFLPGKLLDGTQDPEGILGTIPAISTALLGMLAGDFLMSPFGAHRPGKKAGVLALAGALLLVAAWIWEPFFPVNKHLWTGTFVCLVGGLSLLLFSAFYLVIDVWGYRRWAFFLVVIGMNSITIYLAKKVIDFKYTARFLFEGVVGLLPEGWQPVGAAAGVTAVGWLLVYFFYRNRIFLRV